MTCNAREPNRFRDARHILMIAQITPGLPFPSVCADRASFNFTGIVHAEDAEKAVRAAEADLGKALGVTFCTWWPEPIGSARHCILIAVLPSGLEVDLVALAEHIKPEDAPVSREREPELAVA